MDGYLDEFSGRLSSQTMERLFAFGRYTNPDAALDEIDRIANDVAVMNDPNNDGSVALMWVIESPMTPSILGFAFTESVGDDVSVFMDDIKDLTSMWLREHGSLTSYPLASDTQLVAMLVELGFKETSRAKLYSTDGVVRERITMEIG